jgi:hypothetical protein
VSELKKCSKCKEEVPKTQFNKNRTTKDGLDRRCSQCKKIEASHYESSKKQWVNQSMYGLTDSDY